MASWVARVLKSKKAREIAVAVVVAIATVIAGGKSTKRPK
jgi:hypothetical protein